MKGSTNPEKFEFDAIIRLGRVVRLWKYHICLTQVFHFEKFAKKYIQIHTVQFKQKD